MSNSVNKKKSNKAPLSRGVAQSAGGLNESKYYTGDFAHIPYNPDNVDYAREQRQTESLAEKRMWYDILKEKKLSQYKFTRQKPLLNYIVDFYCSELGLVIEVDGDDHEEKKEYDEKRTRELESYGLKVLRFHNLKAMEEVPAVEKGILEWIDKRKVELLNPPVFDHPPSELADRGASEIASFGEVSRALFDGHDDAAYSNEFEYGVSESVVRKIWEQNKEPEWMLEKRFASLKVFQEKVFPTWGPDLSKLDLAKICYYARPEGASNAQSWDDVPDTIKNTFERLGIPEAERTMLAGVGAQYDSEVVYHNLRQELRDQGVIFEDMSVAVHEHAELVQKYFMKLIPASDHIFAALHGAVWSGGTFLYVPKGVEIGDPLQAYFRMNVKSGGQFEHTLMIIEDEATAHYIEGCSAPKYNTPSLHAGMVEIFVGKKAKMRYTSVENWSIDTYNLNTKRSLVQEEGYMEWVGGNFGSGVTMLYPCTILQGRKSSCDHLGVAFANAGMEVDGGAKVIHIGEDTSSNVIMKSLSKGGGLSTYRGLLDIQPSAHNAVSRIDCDALILDALSKNDTIPDIRVRNSSSICAHEASAGRISEEQLYYLRSRGIAEDQAKAMIINGFISPIVKELPLEYAAELNALIALEMEGSVG